ARFRWYPPRWRGVGLPGSSGNLRPRDRGFRARATGLASHHGDVAASLPRPRWGQPPLFDCAPPAGVVNLRIDPVPIGDHAVAITTRVRGVCRQFWFLKRSAIDVDVEQRHRDAVLAEELSRSERTVFVSLLLYVLVWTAYVTTATSALPLHPPLTTSF